MSNSADQPTETDPVGGCCGHRESEHETQEYRGDKRRHCLRGDCLCTRWMPPGQVLAADPPTTPIEHHPFVGGYAIDPKRPAHCQTCGRHISEHTHGYRLATAEETHELLAGRTPVPAEATGKSGPSLWLLHELRAYLDAQVITGESIGDIRRACFLPWDSVWNGWVRDETAAREGRGVPAAPGLDPATHAHIVEALGECIANVETMDVRTFPIDVAGLLVAARAARVALGMQLLPAPAVPLRVWSCKIGEVENDALPEGADSPLRQAVAEAYRTLTGRDPVFLFSGWGGSLDARERAEVNSEPTSPSI